MSFTVLADFFDNFINNYAAYEYPVASAQLFLAMLGMGALLTPQDFMLEVKKPRGMVVGLSCQWLLVPLIAYVLGSVLPIPAGMAVGLIFVAALVTTPLLLKLLASHHLPDDFTMPVGLIARDIFGTLIIPLVLGTLIKARTTTHSAERF